MFCEEDSWPSEKTEQEMRTQTLLHDFAKSLH